MNTCCRSRAISNNGLGGETLIETNKTANNGSNEFEKELNSFKSRIDELEIENKQLKDENGKFQQNMTNQELNHQSLINQLKRENEVAKYERIDLEEKLSSFKSRNDELESEIKQKIDNNMKKQESNHQSVINKLKRENETAKNRSLELEKELSSFKLRMDQLESDNKRHEDEKNISLRDLPEVDSHIKQDKTNEGILNSYLVVHL